MTGWRPGYYPRGAELAIAASAAEAEDVRRQLADLVAAEGTKAKRRARQRLQRRDAEELAHLLIRGLAVAQTARAFIRTARLLAEIGGDQALHALATQARTQKRFPRLSVQALARCSHPDVIPILLDLLEHARIKQRREAAKQLGILGAAVAIEPLCRAAARGSRDIGPEAHQALHSFGRPGATAARVLAEPAMSVHDRIRALVAMSEVMLFNPQRYLDRTARTWFSPVREQAREAGELLRSQLTLLRPAAPAGDRLLRPAGFARTGHSTLLRPADDEDEEEEGPIVSRRPSILRRLLGRR